MIRQLHYRSKLSLNLIASASKGLSLSLLNKEGEITSAASQRGFHAS